ncbi:class II fumarate hydratase [Desulfoprunum benzoelyticum]|uniref:Fumarate hydratase class II n=1 Tax=Desulfoprunum benzoelyticum TaxID=1506996 RepID=A0A840V765_9BACT|nr:class II fumarate hydratase [Desulfoprunum benzoelyticum]MBB5348851.1 fumarate hydratase class II [Desulfoprunum benzoelyticum]MBM9530091.1 class II fumarate hydratase [Desulfoprunum benzoelyticum]
MTTTTYRTERDSMGAVSIPADALYGPQTQRAIGNFTISQKTIPWALIRALARIKQAAAETNTALGLLNRETGEAIRDAAGEIAQGAYREHFPVSVYQTGSGTSTNMNVNEVISSIAGKRGINLSPNDHVNLGQSTNDVFPTAMQLAAAEGLTLRLDPALQVLADSIRRKAQEYNEVVKTGRTHLMDALPVYLRDEMEAWAVAVDECRERLADVLPRLLRLPLGGTAVGSGVNCHPDFAAVAVARLAELTALPCTSGPSLFKGLSSLDTVVEVSGQLKTVAVVLMKIAGDLRWMNSGPLAGIGEITLPALQPGSSIMPAKVNPVIPEAVCMAAAQVIGHDAVITLAGQSGNFQLNTMLPLVATDLIEAVDLLAGSARSLAGKAIDGLRVNIEACTRALSRNPILVTALTPEIGYLKAAELAKLAMEQDKPILEAALAETDLPPARLRRLLDPRNLAGGGGGGGASG